MTSRPILFSAPMVRALLAGTKTQTRRILKPQPTDAMWDAARANLGGDTARAYPVVHRTFGIGLRRDDGAFSDVGFIEPNMQCPYGKPGDRLWVRETWGLHRHFDITDWERRSVAGLSSDQVLSGLALDYQADWSANQEHCFWRPSIHMPRWASRITLEITGVRVERLQGITGRDVLAEGVDNGKSNPAMGQRYEIMQRLAFAGLWESINGPGSWDANPWVWVVEFKRVGD